MRTLPVLTFALFAACNIDPDVVTVDVNFVFPDADATNTVPLDAVDGLPIRVQVIATGVALRDATGVTAHVWMVDGVGSQLPSGSAANTDIAALALEPGSDGLNAVYSAVATLDVPWLSDAEPTTFQVAAEVDGATSVVTEKIQSPNITIPDISLSPLWSGTVPRYAFCVETSASKGFVDLVAPDPSALGTQPANAGTLITGPCDPGGSGLSHTDFVVTYSPDDLAISAVLRGKPPIVDPAAWTATLTLPTSTNPIITLSPSVAGTPIPTATGYSEAVNVKATSSSGVDIVGLPVSFTTSTTTDTFLDNSVVTDSSGIAQSSIVLPYGAQLLGTFSSAGGGAASLPLGAATIMLAPSPPVAVPVSNLPGILYAVTATATANDGAGSGSGVSGIALAFAGAGLTFQPSTVFTAADGTATSQVLVPFGTQVEATIAGGGTFASVLLGAPAITLTPATPVVVTAPNLPGVLYNVTATASGGGGSVVSAVALAFAGGGLTFQPSTVFTAADGTATSQVLVPFGTQVEATIAGGGTFATILLGAPVVTLTIDPPTQTPSPTVSALTAHAWVDSAKTIPAVGVGLTFSGPTTATLSPSTVVTDATGTAKTQIFNFTTGNLVVTGGGGLAGETL